MIHPLKHLSEKAYLELVPYSASTDFCDMSDDEAVMKTLGSQSEEMARKLEENLQGPQDRYLGLQSESKTDYPTYTHGLISEP